MDLNEIKPVTSFELEILHPATGDKLKNDDDTPMTISLAGSRCDAGQDVTKKLQEKKLGKLSRSQKTSLVASNEEKCELLVACTAGWNITLDKEKPVFNKDAAYELFMRYEWIRDQAIEANENQSHFFTSA